jgi:uncharacterized protein (TIGR02246 family)
MRHARRQASAAVAALVALVTAASGAAVASPASAAKPAKDCAGSSTEIMDATNRILSAWDHGDAAGVAQGYRPDGDLVLSTGQRLAGRAAIKDYYTTAFAGPLKGTRAIGSPTSMRCVADTVAVSDGLLGILLPGESYTDPAQVPLGRRFAVSVVAVSDGASWSVAQLQSTTIAG